MGWISITILVRIAHVIIVLTDAITKLSNLEVNDEFRYETFGWV